MCVLVVGVVAVVVPGAHCADTWSLIYDRCGVCFLLQVADARQADCCRVGRVVVVVVAVAGVDVAHVVVVVVFVVVAHWLRSAPTDAAEHVR